MNTEKHVAEISVESDYWSGGHFYEGQRKVIRTTGDIRDLPVGTPLMAAKAWDEATQRQAFEDAMYAHYLRQRALGKIRIRVEGFDEEAAPLPREVYFQRPTGIDYAVHVVQAAWGGWRLARGGL